MSRIKRLLIATDLSTPARHAAERAALFAGDVAGTLDLLHVVATAPLDKLRRLVREIPAEAEQRLVDAAREELRQLAESLSSRYGVTAGVHVVSGAVVRRLNEEADAREADLIVLGARGAGLVQTLLLGSTAEKMVSRATRPLLVVKQPPRGSYRRLLVPVDFSPASLPALRRAHAVAPEAELILLHAFDVPFEGKLRLAGVPEETVDFYRAAAKEEAMQKMGELLAAAGLEPQSARRLVLHGDPWRNIVEQEREQDCDLIVMGRRGEGMLEEFLLGSVTKRVLTDCHGDVLVSV
ncbi:MAG: universal stress protein [Gammaproteobacteria bacterium]|nr:universal stress protein [Gammaproteobacteria bacterium]